MADEPTEETTESATSTEHIGRLASLKKRLAQLWQTRRGKLIISGSAVSLVLVVTIATTNARYMVLGPLVKTSARVTALDSQTGQPLPGAMVAIGGQSAETDTDGVAELTGLRAGPAKLTVSKKAYRDQVQDIRLKLRPNELAPIRLESAGVDVVFKLKDKITAEDLSGVEITVGDSEAVSKDGTALVSLLPSEDNRLKATLQKSGYLDLSLEIEVKERAEYSAELVPAGKVYYLSNRTGRIDLYESNLDGSAATVVLAGTGREDSNTGILPSIKAPNLLAMVANREGKPALYLFNSDGRKLTKIDDEVDFYNYRAWVGDYLVYHKYDKSASCNLIKTYQVTNGRRETPVSGDQAKGCPSIKATVGDMVFYSVQRAESQDNIGLFVLRVGSSTKRVSNVPADYIARRVKQTLLYEYYNYSYGQSSESWYSVALPELAVSALSEKPNFETLRAFNDSPGGQLSVFIEERDGKTELYVTDGAGNNERKLTNMGSVNQFVQWIGDRYVIFSSTKSDENALYIVSPAGGQPVKIGDFYKSGGRGGYGGGYNPVY